MFKKTYTILEISKDFNKDKQVIRRLIARLNIEPINKDTRIYINDPLLFNHKDYMLLAKELSVSISDTTDIQNDTPDIQGDTQGKKEDLSKDKLIEVLERELVHSKERLEKSEQEKESLMKLLDQQQRLTLQANHKIELIEDSEQKEDLENKSKWYSIFKKKI